MFRSKIQRHVKDETRKSCRLFYTKDFQSLMYPCFTLCRILGMFPYKSNASTFEISKPYYILSTIIICAYCVSYLLFIHGIIISGTITYESITKNLEVVGYYTLNCLVVITTHILCVPRMRLLQTILEISSKLPSKSYKKLSRFIHVKDILCPILLVVHIYIFFSKVQTLELNYFSGLSMIFGTYGALLVLQMNMLYINCVCILKAYFEKINDDLMHMRQPINDIKPSIPSIYHMHSNQFILMELKLLKKQHLMTAKTVQILNIIFSLQLLATIIDSFSEITFELYFSAVRWQGKLLVSLDWDHLDAFIICMVHYVSKIILLVWACETGKNQTQKINMSIYDVLNSTKDEQIKAELQLFSLQILHCENTFSAKGLTIDATLLTAMVGSITTYMLILIQFFVTTHSCNEKYGINTTSNGVT